MEDEGPNYARFRAQLHGVPHYYGDIVRQLFLVSAAVMLVAAPFYADTLSLELPFEIMGAIVLVALAAAVNPHNRLGLYGNAIASGVGLVLYETWALYPYSTSTWMQFTLRQFVALLFLAAFYFSMKTVRALIFHQIGKREGAESGPGEFDEEEGRPLFGAHAAAHSRTRTEGSEPPAEWLVRKPAKKTALNGNEGAIKLRCEVDDEEGMEKA